MLCTSIDEGSPQAKFKQNQLIFFLGGLNEPSCIFFCISVIELLIRQNYRHALEGTVAEWVKDAAECPCGHWASGRNSGSYRE